MKSQNYMIIHHNAYNMEQKISHLIFKVSFPGKQIKLQEITFPLEHTETPR